jgi:hypothetical protein
LLLVQGKRKGVTVVVVKLIGGLGNQLFQYALGRRISIKRNVPLKLDLSDFESYQLRQYGLHHLNIVEDIATPEDLARFERNAPKAPVNFISQFGAKLFPYYFRYITFVESGLPFDPDVLKIRGNLYLDGYWQSEKYFKEIEGVIRREFTVKDRPDPLTEQIAQTISDTDSVCLHIRRGDYVSNSETNKIYGVCSLDYYDTAMRELMRTVMAPHYFVFSDDPQWVQDNLKPGHPTTFVTHNDTSKDYEDLRLMSLCKHFIIANSSFSWWGAWLGAHPKKLVFSPRAWFQTGGHDTRDLRPDSWYLI